MLAHRAGKEDVMDTNEVKCGTGPQNAQMPVCPPEQKEVRGVDILPVEYVPSSTARLRIENNFRYHAPKEHQAKRYEFVRNEFRKLANLLIEQCPESRELSVAMTNLEDANMWANAAIARNE